jgi:hypothetical protein
MVENAMTGASPSHAVLLNDQEAIALTAGETDSLIRTRTTELRMQVGLLRPDGTIVATARLVDAVGVQSEMPGNPRCAWKFSEIEPLGHHMVVSPIGGPLWRRLSLAEREMVVGNRSSVHGTEFVVQPIGPAQPVGGDQFGTAMPPSGIDPMEVMDKFFAEETEHDLAIAEKDAEVGDNLLVAPALSAAPGTLDEKVVAHATTDDTALGMPDTLEAARNRAFAYVPLRMVEVDEAYQILIRLRDTEIKPTFPGVRPEHGILRRKMLQAMLDLGVASQEDYDKLIPSELKRMTERRQVEIYLEPILKILACVA